MVNRQRHAFTLLELVATIVVIAIVGIIGVVVYQGAADRARGADASTAVNRVLVAQQTWAGNRGYYTSDPTDLHGIGRDLTVTNGPSDNAATVSMGVDGDGDLLAASLSSNGDCYAVRGTNPLAGSARVLREQWEATGNAACAWQNVQVNE